MLISSHVLDELQTMVEIKDEEIRRLRKEKNWWKNEFMQEIRGSYYSHKMVERVIKKYERRMEKELGEEND